MIRRRVIAAAVLLAGCGAPGPGVEDFAADPQSAERAVADCDAGRARRDCEAAWRGLAEARRRQRMAAYARAL
ncbi:MAG: hypothetical protein ACK4VY_03955 [Brevundimonas sp.]